MTWLVGRNVPRLAPFSVTWRAPWASAGVTTIVSAPAVPLTTRAVLVASVGSVSRAAALAGTTVAELPPAGGVAEAGTNSPAAQGPRLPAASTARTCTR